MSDDDWSEDEEAGKAMLSAAFAAFASVDANDIDTGAILRALIDVKRAAASVPSKPNKFRPDGLSVIASVIWSRLIDEEIEDMAPVCLGANPIRAFARAAILADHLVNAECVAEDEGFPCGMSHAEQALAIYTKANEE